MLDILRILVPVDFSKESDLALNWAVTIAGKKRGATIYLLHVLPPAPSGVGNIAYKEEQEQVVKKLAVIQRRIPADIITFRNHYAPSGDGQRFLVDSADDHEPISVVVNWTALLSTH